MPINKNYTIYILYIERQATSVIHNKDDIVEKQEIENKKVAENIDINDMSESLLKNQFENSNNISPRKFTPNVDTSKFQKTKIYRIYIKLTGFNLI